MLTWFDCKFEGTRIYLLLKGTLTKQFREQWNLSIGDAKGWKTEIYKGSRDMLASCEALVIISLYVAMLMLCVAF